MGGYHLVPGPENMVDGTFLQIHIQVQQLVQQVTCQQMHCLVKVVVSGSTFLSASL